MEILAPIAARQDRYARTESLFWLADSLAEDVPGWDDVIHPHHLERIRQMRRYQGDAVGADSLF